MEATQSIFDFKFQPIQFTWEHLVVLIMQLFRPIQTVEMATQAQILNDDNSVIARTVIIEVQGSVSIGFLFDAIFIQAFLLLDVCGVIGGNNFLTFRALLEGWIVRVIMRSTMFGPVVLFLRPRSDLLLWVSIVITATCTAYTSRTRIISKSEMAQQYVRLDDESSKTLL